MTEVIGPYVEFIYCDCNCGRTRSKYYIQKDGRVRKDALCIYIQGHTWKGKKHTEEAKQKVSQGNTGKIRSEEARKKYSEAKKGKSLGERAGNWAGDNIKYVGLHHWIRRNLPKPEDGLCMLCKKAPIIEAACITGIYNREFRNWAWFCRICHKGWDNSATKAWIKRRKKMRCRQLLQQF